MYYAYLLQCADNTIYAGYTNDLSQRIEAHNNGIGAKYTRSRLPVKLMYYEGFTSKSEALKREATLKRLSRKQKIKLIEDFQIDPHEFTMEACSLKRNRIF